jgi:hypothetical protein
MRAVMLLGQAPAWSQESTKSLIEKGKANTSQIESSKTNTVLPAPDKPSISGGGGGGGGGTASKNLEKEEVGRTNRQIQEQLR